MLAKIKLRECTGENYYYIVGFENIITKQDLPDEYFRDYPYFYASKYNNIPCITVVTRSELFRDENYPEYRSLRTSTYYLAIVKHSHIYKDDLPKLIAILKSAGQRLTDIRRKKKEFTITI